MLIESPLGASKYTDIIECMGPELESDEIDTKKVRARNFVLSSDDGRLIVYGPPPFFQENMECYVMNCHTSAINQMKRSADHKTIITSGQDGAIFIYRVNELPNLSYGKYSKQEKEKYDEIKDVERRKKNHKDRMNLNGSIESIDVKEKSTITNEEDQEKETMNQNTITQHSKQEDNFEESEGSDRDIPENWK